MSPFPPDQDDRKLIAFLKEYCPIPPNSNEDCEAKLMTEINLLCKTECKNSPRRLFWLIPGAIATGLLILWGGLGLLNPNRQLVNLTTDQELEAFLTDGWYGAMGETSYRNAQSDFEEEWSFISY
jgi:hypothetical protein